MKGKLLAGLTLLLMLFALAGCGGGPKPDVSIFVMPPNGMQQEITDKLQSALQAKLGAKPTVAVSSSPLYSLDKLVVEVAAGGHGIIIVPEDQFKSLTAQGGMVSLDDLFNPADYPTGVLDLPVDSSENAKKEKHLYGIPVSQTWWMKAAGYNGPELYAFLHPRAPNMAAAKQVLKAIAQK